MPFPPPAMPDLAPPSDTGVTCALCGGSGRLSMRATGAACACPIVPVVSGPVRAATGLSLKRDASPLHAAIPIAVKASATARGHDAERSHSGPDIPTTHASTQYRRAS